VFDHPANLSPALRRLAALLTVLLFATGCNLLGQSTSTPVPSPSSTPALYQPQSAWERALEDIGDDGQFSKDAALNLFATAFGPLPGVDVRQDLTGIGDRTLAIQAVMHVYGDLTPDQQSAVTDKIKPPADSELLTGHSAPLLAGLGAVAAAPAYDVKVGIIDAINSARETIAGKMGRNLAGDINVHFKEEPAGEKYILGQAWSDWSGGVFGDCDITIFSAASAEEPGFWLSTAYHEVFHCFQFDGYRTLEAERTAPAWVIEGQASWVGEKLSGGISTTKLHAWDRYLTIPYRPLTTRAYDAIGFYAHIEETGVDPWAVFRPMWDAGSDNIAIFDAASADRQSFLDSWASSVLRQPSRGVAWTTDGPGITDSAYQPNIFNLDDGSKVDLSAPFFTNDVRYIAINTDMIHVQIDGHGRLSDGSVDITQLSDVWFCVEGKKCEKKCENAPEPPATAGTVTNFVALASSGGTDGTVGTATGKDLEKDCETPTPDEFCSRYRDYVDWAKSNGSSDITKPLAAEIASRFTDMQPFAPTELAVHVALMIRVYSTYATAPEPYDIPTVGPDAAHIYEALTAMNAYCHVTFP